MLIALFAAIHPSKVSSTQETVYLNIKDRNYALYMSYYLAICAIGRFQTVLFSFRYARTIRDFWLRLGMCCVAGGSALILVYCAVRYWQILALHTDFVDRGPWKFLSGSSPILEPCSRCSGGRPLLGGRSSGASARGS